ncbi:DNA-directed RNA polymerase III complex subunit Rpc25 [Tyrophagus putrescentiae]|nr:DNA-directed RNA polymerase III complex subunit Rpc25 [Tyrophagus putrescentiae]
MFKLIELSRRICIPCRFFDPHADHHRLLVLLVNQSMQNKVIRDAGIFILLTSIEAVEVLPTIMNKSDIFAQVTFRCLVFTAVKDETLVGTISDCSPEHGLSINLKFYRSVQVDVNYLPPNSKKIEGADYYFPMLKGDEVRFKVLETKFNRYNIVNQEKAVEPIITYATCKQELLGPVSWWTT